MTGNTRTPASLLERLRTDRESDAWPRFVDYFSPMVFRWARGTGMQEQDAADLVQDVFVLVFRKMPTFEYDPQKSFRAWLRTVTLNQWRNRAKQRRLPLTPDGDLTLAQDPIAESLLEDAEYRTQLVRQALKIMQADFDELTWQSCWQMVVFGRPAAEIAAEFGLTLGAVHARKCRVLRRLRQELLGLWE